MARAANTYRANGAGKHLLVEYLPTARGGRVRVDNPNPAAIPERTIKAVRRSRYRASIGRWDGRGDPAAQRSIAAMREKEAKAEKKRAADRQRRAKKREEAPT